MKLSTFSSVAVVFLIVVTCLAASGTTTALAEEPEMKQFLDLQYAQYPGSDPALNRLDIYAPATGGPYPVVVFIHGGSWHAGDKKVSAQVIRLFTGQGYVFASINYRLAPAVKHPGLVQDVAKALAWINKNGGQYAIDTKRVFVMGHSAGAHLAAIIATDERYLKAEGLNLSALSGSIPIDGEVYNLEDNVRSGGVAAQMRVEDAFGPDRAVWKDASPASHIAAGKGIPPFLLIHAGNRQDSKQGSESLAKAAREAGGRAEVYHAADKDHGSVVGDLGAPGDGATREILYFLCVNTRGADKCNLETIWPLPEGATVPVAREAVKPSAVIAPLEGPAGTKVVMSVVNEGLGTLAGAGLHWVIRYDGEDILDAVLTPRVYEGSWEFTAAGSPGAHEVIGGYYMKTGSFVPYFKFVFTVSGGASALPQQLPSTGGRMPVVGPLILALGLVVSGLALVWLVQTGGAGGSGTPKRDGAATGRNGEQG